MNKAPWDIKYQLEYGLKPIIQETTFKKSHKKQIVVHRSICCFCTVYGRSNLEESRLKRPCLDHYACGPHYRKDAIKYHLKKYHEKEWNEYCVLNHEEKNMYWTTRQVEDMMCEENIENTKPDEIVKMDANVQKGNETNVAVALEPAKEQLLNDDWKKSVESIVVLEPAKEQRLQSVSSSVSIENVSMELQQMDVQSPVLEKCVEQGELLPHTTVQKGTGVVMNQDVVVPAAVSVEKNALGQQADRTVNSMKRKDYLQWDDYFMGVAFLSAMRSKDPKTQVGACIVNDEKKIVGIGYNGFPLGCSDDDLSWSREHDNVLETKYPYVCHAEMNAILNKNSISVKNCTLYVALFPCNECAKLIIQSGIKEIIYISDKYHNDWKTIASRRMLDMAKVSYRKHTVQKTTIEIDFSILS